MSSGKGSGFWRVAAVAALALAAAPLIWAGRPGRHVPLEVKPGETWEVPGEIVVDLRDGAARTDVDALASRYGVPLQGAALDENAGRIFAVKTTPALAAGLLARLRTDPLVERAEPQKLYKAFWAPNDPRYKEQWNFARIHMEQAWEITKGKGAVVAVIDSGVAFENDSKCYRCRDFDRTKFTSPYDFVANDKHPTDDHGHGTHVAGTIAESTDNGEGVAGIAFEATVMPLKVLDYRGYGTVDRIAAAIRYAADHGANVINMSLGGPLPSDVMRDACRYAVQKGVTVVCAAGNGGREGVGYPAAYPECIAVSALGPEGEMAPYSSWGSEVAVSAPGGDKTKGEAAGILQNTYINMSGREAGAGSALADAASEPTATAPDATAPGATAGRKPTGQVDGYYAFQGTSMASPHVAGVAALIVSRGVKDPTEVREILMKSAQRRGDRKKYGAGEIDAAAAVKLAGSTSSTYRARLALIAALWAWCLFVGKTRGRGMRAAPVATTLAFTLGLLMPDVFTAFVGISSPWNWVGHSVLLPGFLLVAEAESGTERRFYGLMAAGLALHLGWDLLQGTGPLVGTITWAALPWLWTNVVVGAGAFLAGLRRA